MHAPRTFTLVSFHAHPDDESLLTGGTLARAAADGHRVVLVTATAGERGLAGPDDGTGAVLARVRMDELEAAAAILGCARLVSLGYADSGLHPGADDRDAFANADVQEAAMRLAQVLVEERADVLTVYDPNGGYGHPDHVQVHRVGALAARLAGTPVVLEATVPAGLLTVVLGVLRALRHPLGTPPLEVREVFSDGKRITHRVRVGAASGQKREAMRAHGSQRRAAGQVRVIDRFVRLPMPLFRLVFGHEWFVEQGREPGARSADVFATVRGHRSWR